MAGGTALARRSWRQALNAVRLARRQSRFQTLVVAAFAVTFELGLAALFWSSFRFLDQFGGAGMLIIQRLFDLFYLGLASMLVLSGTVAAYASIFRSQEVPFLLTRPVSFSQIVVYKFLEAMGLASWAFFFIIIPFTAAYAVHQHLSPLFVLWTFLFSVPLLALCAGVAAFAVLVLVRWVPARAVRGLVGLALLGALCGGLVYLSLRRPAAGGEVLELDINRLAPGLRMAGHPLLPSRWASDGILALSRGEWSRAGLLWAALAANVALIVMLIEWVGGRIFYAGWQKASAGAAAERRRPVLWAGLERALAGLLPRDALAVAMKDIRIFIRDPMQWSQALIFFGLLAVYFANLRSFNYHLFPDRWRNMIVFLNVFSVGAILCSLGSRFVYPQLSLEGQAFWILGLSPATMRRILLTKFLLTASAMGVQGMLLIGLSCRMLQTSGLVTAVSVGLVAAMSASICGLSTGLGAIFLDLRQQNPSAIVSGFGGTLNLVLSLAYLLAVVVPFGVLFHVQAGGALPPAELARWLAAGLAWLTLATALCAGAPLWLGARALRLRDY